MKTHNGQIVVYLGFLESYTDAVNNKLHKHSIESKWRIFPDYKSRKPTGKAHFCAYNERWRKSLWYFIDKKHIRTYEATKFERCSMNTIRFL